jgi:acetyl esterase/lipase
VRPPYDPELAVLLDNSPLPTTVTAEMIGFLRANPFGPTLEDLLAVRALSHREYTVPGPGGDLTASVFTPAGKDPAAPAIYFLHGGGMIIGNRFTGIGHVLDWAVEHRAVVISLEYRLAPEAPAPGPVEDAYAGLLWLAENAPALGIDPQRILINGTSAGAGLAAGVTLLARDRKGPALIAQMLLSPMLDDRDATASSHQYTQTGSWSRESNDTGWNALLGHRRGSNDVDIYTAPARATDLTGLPPAFIDVGSAEVFRDEDTAYATRLWAHGVQAELHVWAGGFHIFDGAAPQAQLSIAAINARDSWIRRTLGRLPAADAA